MTGITWKPLDKGQVFGWHRREGVSVRGYAWLPDGSFASNEGLLHAFHGKESEAEFAERVAQLNGCFAVVIEGEGFFAAAVDRLRTFPLFYFSFDNHVWVTDFLEPDPPQLDEAAAGAFKALYFTEGSSTLLQGWKQLTGGQYLYVHGPEPGPVNYYIHANAQKWSSKELTTDAINKTHATVMKRQAASTAGRPVAILLSGGYDSRWLIAEWRVRHKGPLYAITYGKSRSYDTMTAEQIARKLLVKWIFVPHSPELLDRFDTPEWEAYALSNHMAVSTPYEQDFFALEYVRQHKWIPDDTIIIPGFCGDLLGGSIFDVFNHEWSKSGLSSYISNKYTHHIDPELPPGLDILDKVSFWDAWQHWFVVNRVSKFLVNGVRAYSHLGYEWRLPLWDHELMDFWYKVPLSSRMNQDLYDDWLWMKAFRPLDLDEWEKPAYDANTNNSRLKAWLKSVLPQGWVKRYRESQLKSGRYDPNYLLYLYYKLNARLRDKVEPDTYNFNDAHARYMLEKYWHR